jgi:hypothetical protein
MKDSLVIEVNIAQAHRCLDRAIFHASTQVDLGLHDDLQLIQLELERLQVDLLRGTRRRMKVLSGPAYLSDSVRDDRSPAA